MILMLQIYHCLWKQKHEVIIKENIANNSVD